MRAETIHVTDHALKRWRERASKTSHDCVHDIVDAVKNSKVLRKRKKEFLPCPMPRRDGSVYSFHEGVLFVLEPITIDEYNLVTVICNEHTKKFETTSPEKRPNKTKAPIVHVQTETPEITFQEMQIPEFANEIDEKTWLITEKSRHEQFLNKIAKSADHNDVRKIAVRELFEIEDRLTAIKNRIKEQTQGILENILSELKTAKLEINELKAENIKIRESLEESKKCPTLLNSLLKVYSSISGVLRRKPSLNADLKN